MAETKAPIAPPAELERKPLGLSDYDRARLEQILAKGDELRELISTFGRSQSIAHALLKVREAEAFTVMHLVGL